MPQAGFKFIQRQVPSRYKTKDVMSQILAAVDISDQTCDALDLLMRQYNTDPVRFQMALDACPRRRGNRRRRKVVKRSQSRPWSQAEREYHDLFDRYHIKGWTANKTINVGGAQYKPDAAIPRLKLIMEIDGYSTHGNREAFESDRYRQNDLAKAGWTVLRFTWAMLAHPDEIIRTIKTTMARLSH